MEILGKKIDILNNGGWEEYKVIGKFLHPCFKVHNSLLVPEQGGVPGRGRTQPVGVVLPDVGGQLAMDNLSSRSLSAFNERH